MFGYSYLFLDFGFGYFSWRFRVLGCFGWFGGFCGAGGVGLTAWLVVLVGLIGGFRVLWFG